MDLKVIGLAIGLLVQASGIVWWAAGTANSIRHNQYQILVLTKDVDRNSNFVRDWPSGKMGRLPDDVDQSLRIEWLESQMAKLNNRIFEIGNGSSH